ncbi:MAG: hypothetical protein K9G13_04330 [Aquiluna sp.]|nr:hypothetical protein [Aquiluna sp.]MCF8545747.1 hypothetical protein [Aquiluna sp.]
MDALIAAIFTFGFSIFYGLSLIEKSVWPLIFRNKPDLVSDHNIVFTHTALKRLTPLLPPSNGVVILAGTSLLFWQAVNLDWSWQSTLLPVFYILMMAGIVLIGKNPAVVFSIRSHGPESPLPELRRDLRLVGIHHHIALFTNLAVVIFQLSAITFA